MTQCESGIDYEQLEEGDVVVVTPNLLWEYGTCSASLLAGQLAR